MLSTLVAVYGCYNSRGGTMAIPLNEGSNQELGAAHRDYNTEVYMLSSEEIFTLYEEGSRTPAENDFMFVARLNHPNLFVQDKFGTVDLDDQDRVLIDPTFEPMWDGLGRFPACKTVENGGDFHERLGSTSHFNRHAPFHFPVSLEHIPLEDGWDSEFLEVYEDLEVQARGNGTPLNTWSSDWTPEQTRGRKILDEIVAETYEAPRRAAILARAKIVKPPLARIRRWHDDAYGFVVKNA